jgi:hypothetical protein
MEPEGSVLYAAPNIIRIIKSRRKRWVGQVACMGEMRNAYQILVRKLERKRPDLNGNKHSLNLIQY